jgi:CheY-like chemotaxis protein
MSVSAVTWRRSGIGGKVARILICEDDELYRQLAEVAFASSGHEVEFLDSGYAVMKKLASGHYDLLITDIVMPDKDGLEVIREIRGQGCDVPVLVMSGGMSNLKVPILAAAQALGANEVISKPFRPPALREQAEALLKAAQARRLGQTA